MRRLFLDTAVLALARGGDHDQREACRAIVRMAATRSAELHVSAEAVQELLFHRMRRVDRLTAVAETTDVCDLVVIHPVDRRELDRALHLVATSPLRGRDALHAATALLSGFDSLVSPDADFDLAPGLMRLEPSAVPG